MLSLSASDLEGVGAETREALNQEIQLLAVA